MSQTPAHKGCALHEECASHAKEILDCFPEDAPPRAVIAGLVTVLASACRTHVPLDMTSVRASLAFAQDAWAAAERASRCLGLSDERLEIALFDRRLPR